MDRLGGLTVADTMANLITVVTLDHWALDFIGLLGTLRLHVTQLLAVGTLDNASINRLASILQAFRVLLRSWPSILFLRTGGLVRPTPSNRVLLVQVTLEVH
jgi:hypothetical protein